MEDEKDLFVRIGEEFEPFDQPCYSFNDSLPIADDDRFCEHCKKYLTTECEHLGEFMDDIEDY